MNFKKFHDNAQLPIRQTVGAAGYDLCALDGHNIGALEIVKTGVGVQIPDGCVGLIRDRSGHAAKHGITVLAGVIDSDYTGEVMVVLSCVKEEGASIKAGDRIAQLVIVPCVMEGSEWVDDLTKTARGDGKFGSTGL